MEDFRRQFLSQNAETLENLYRNIQSAEAFSEVSKREVFRVLHTVKGTAQTFGYTAASRLAHALETLLSADQNTVPLFLEGIKLLQKSLTEETFQIPEEFTNKIGGVMPESTSKANETGAYPAEIPAEIYSRLATLEKNMIGSAIRAGKSLSLLEVGFELGNFAAELVSFRQRLNSSSEIIATFPSRKTDDAGKIGFQFLVTGNENVEALAKENAASLVWNFEPKKSANGIGGVFKEITRHGAEIAVRLHKKVDIRTSADEMDFSANELKIIFEVLLHLVRNAIDHAVESVGKIEIKVEKKAGGFCLSVADDGRGIDLERIKARAIEKKLISAAENLTETELMNLIFQSEFSTKTESTEISGRGVGLDAVKFAVEKFGGTINVVSRKNKGTTFEILLPQPKT